MKKLANPIPDKELGDAVSELNAALRELKETLQDLKIKVVEEEVRENDCDHNTVR